MRMSRTRVYTRINKGRQSPVDRKVRINMAARAQVNPSFPNACMFLANPKVA